jgi:hypothetical protein
MLLIQVEQTLGTGFPSGKIGKAVDNLLVLFSLLFCVSADFENLGQPGPLALKKGVHFGDFPKFRALLACHGLCGRVCHAAIPLRRAPKRQKNPPDLDGLRVGSF